VTCQVDSLLLYKIYFRVHENGLGTINSYTLTFIFEKKRIKVGSVSELNTDIVELEVLVGIKINFLPRYQKLKKINTANAYILLFYTILI
jgi:hypothetical protein